MKLFFILLFTLIQTTKSEYYCRYVSGSNYYYRSYSSSSCTGGYSYISYSGSLTVSSFSSSYFIYEVYNYGNDVYFGSTSSYYRALSTTITFYASGSSYSNYFYFYRLYQDMDLNLNTNGYSLSYTTFVFLQGHHPQRIYGDVKDFKIQTMPLWSDDVINHNVKRGITFMGTATTSSSSYRLTDTCNYYGVHYVISSYGNKFSSRYVSEGTITPVSCGGMYRYYLNLYCGTVTYSTRCLKTYSSTSTDDFDDFVVTATMKNPTRYWHYLYGANIIFASVSSNEYAFKFYTYPNMYVKYTYSTSIKIEIRGHTDRDGKVIVEFTISSSSSTYTSFMEVVNSAKTMTTYICSSTRSITSLVWNAWTVSTYPSQILMIGMGSMGVSTSSYYVSSSYYCKVAVYNPSASTYRKCYLCRSGYSLSSNSCSKCSSSISNCLHYNNCACGICQNGYVWKDGQCISKSSYVSPNNCLQLKSIERCAKCASGYYNNKGSCVSQKTGCLVYGISRCIKCQCGYDLQNDGTCLQKSNSGCYYENGVCIACKIGYTMDTSSEPTCIPKKENQNGINEIIYCQNDGEYIQEKQCKSCSSKFDVDSLKCDSQKVIQCKDGYYFDEYNCISKTICEENKIRNRNGRCTNKIENCLTNGVVNEECHECKEGWYRDPLNETNCINCTDLPNCIHCRGITDSCYDCNSPFGPNCDGKCVLCKEGQFWEDGICKKNMEGCVNQLNSNECISCSNNYYLLNKVCIRKSHEETCSKETTHSCEQCVSGMMIGGGCDKPNIDQCKYYSTQKIKQTINKCHQCNTNYYLTNNNQTCSSIPLEEILYIESNVHYRCKDGYYLNTEMKCTKCQQTDSNSNVCEYHENKLHSYSCQSNKYFKNETSECLLNENCGSFEGSVCITCKERTYHNIVNGECIKCQDPNCESCENDLCLRCKEGYLMTDKNKCESFEEVHCEQSNYQKLCIKCIKGYNLVKTIKVNNQTYSYCEPIETQNCYYSRYENSTSEKKNCTVCEDGYVLSGLDCVLKTSIEQQAKNELKSVILKDNCLDRNEKGCIRCSDGYYMKQYQCLACKDVNKCANCFNETMCMSCPEGYYVNFDYTCSPIGELNATCKHMIPDHSGCAICNDGYYSREKRCYKCPIGCHICFRDTECLQCETNYYMIEGEAPKCLHYDTLDNCTEKLQDGCKKCQDGYYLKNHRCSICSGNCTLCDGLDTCLKCKKDYVILNNECHHYTEITNCIAEDQNKCSQCQGWNKPADDGTSCVYQVDLGVAIGVPCGAFVLMIIVVVIIIYLIYLRIQRKKQEEKMKNICIFKMSRSNIEFNDLNNTLTSNKEVLDFNFDLDEIPVDKETRELLCVGNSSKNNIKIQFSVVEGCDRYEIRSQPQLITLKRDEACEFEVFIKPYCSCELEEEIMIIALDLKTGEQTNVKMKIHAKTEMTTRLDYHELKDDKKLGEGSFGIVFLGDFRGNKVAIKKMKQAQDDATNSMEEFEKEVKMLDKFRCDYIVHFYGACFVPNKICMVTEFAQYGSLQDLMKKRPDAQGIEIGLRVKFLLDAAKGIEYLHQNGILHRDIKPDNFLVLSLEDNVPVNAKLTDFGASRNINMMMTNMTFTKGIGTPKFMAPEILNKQRYKRAADVYAFAITMLEVVTWTDPFPKAIYKFPWSIADTVTQGRRPLIDENLDEDLKRIIKESWAQEPQDRPNISKVISTLATVYDPSHEKQNNKDKEEVEFPNEDESEEDE